MAAMARFLYAFGIFDVKTHYVPLRRTESCIFVQIAGYRRCENIARYIENMGREILRKIKSVRSLWRKTKRPIVPLDKVIIGVLPAGYDVFRINYCSRKRILRRRYQIN